MTHIIMHEADGSAS